MKLNPYLVFNGDCEEAFNRYARCLRGELTVQRFGEGPGCEDLPASHRDKVMHARLVAGDQVLMPPTTIPPSRTRA